MTAGHIAFDFFRPEEAGLAPHPAARCVFGKRGRGMEGNISFAAGDDAGAVAGRRRRLLESLPGLSAIAEVCQVHGDDIIIEPEAGPQPPERLPKADGMLTTRRGLGLLIKTADCQPLFITHREMNAAMALHVGWRGNRVNLPAKGVAVFCGHCGARPKDLLAVRGPSLGPSRAEFVNFESEWGPEFAEFFDAASRRMNLWELTRAQLVRAGLEPENISGIDICTAAPDSPFFSWRRGRDAGRQGSMIWLA